MKHGGTLIGKRLYKGLRSRVIVPTVDNNPPVVVKVPATMGERHYAEKLEEIERKVKELVWMGGGRQGHEVREGEYVASRWPRDLCLSCVCLCASRSD